MGRELEFEAAVSVSQAADYLEKLAQLLREGKGTLAAGRQQLVLRPGAMVVLEVEGSRRKGHGRLEIELEWNEANTYLEVAPGVDEEDEEEDEDFFDDEDEEFLSLDDLELDEESWELDEEEDEEEEEEESEATKSSRED